MSQENQVLSEGLEQELNGAIENAQSGDEGTRVKAYATLRTFRDNIKAASAIVDYGVHNQANGSSTRIKCASYIGSMHVWTSHIRMEMERSAVHDKDAYVRLASFHAYKRKTEQVTQQAPHIVTH